MVKISLPFLLKPTKFVSVKEKTLFLAVLLYKILPPSGWTGKPSPAFNDVKEFEIYSGSPVGVDKD